MRQTKETLAKAAVAAEKQYGIPAEILAAQAALESGWLKKAPGNNLFGIKHSPHRHPPEARQLLTTREWMTEKQAQRWVKEVEGRELLERLRGPDGLGRYEWRVRDWFATYPTPEDCIRDYALMLSRTPRYQKVLAAADWREAVDKLSEAGYATDPTYASKLKAVMDREFQQIIDGVRTA